LLLIFLWALFLQRLVLGGVTALLAPEGPSWRLLPASDGTAAYLSLWSQRFVLVWVWGEALAQAAEALALGADASALLSNLYRFILLLQALVLVSQQRDRVRSLLSAREPEDAAGAVRFAIAACNVVAARWHFVAIPYLIAFFAVWSTGSQVGLNYLLRATALTALVLAVAAALSRLVRLGTKRLFAVSERLKTLVPGIEERANRYTPVISGAMRALIWVGAFLFVLDAWGVPSLDILFSNAGIRFIGGLAGIAITLAVATGAIEACRAAIDHFLSGRRDARGEPILPTPQQRTLLPLGFSVVKWAAISIAGIIILDNLGVNIAPVLAGAGILGLAVGFGAQSLVKDIITGVFLLLENNIAVGDVVKVKDIGGLVEGFNLRSVRLRDYDGNVHVIPNGAIDVVTNYTKEYSRAVFDIGVAYRENVDEVIEVIRQVGEEMRAEPEWADAILEPVEIAGLDRFADSAVVIRGRFKTKPIKQWSVRREFFRRIKIAFDERGIEIPFPYRTLTWAEPKKTEPGPLPSARGERSENPSSPPPGPPRGASGSGRG